MKIPMPKDYEHFKRLITMAGFTESEVAENWGCDVSTVYNIVASVCVARFLVKWRTRHEKVRLCSQIVIEAIKKDTYQDWSGIDHAGIEDNQHYLYVLDHQE